MAPARYVPAGLNSITHPSRQLASAPEIARANAAENQQPRPTHDILEVNDYLTSGLVVSQLDKWFMGPAPRFAPESLGVQSKDVGAALRKARKALNSWDQTVHEVSSSPAISV